MSKHNLIFKIIALLTIQTFIFSTSAAAYPTLGKVSKVGKELRVIPTRKAEISEEIAGRLGGRKLVWDETGLPVNLKVWKIDPKDPQKLIMIFNPYIWTEINENGVCKSSVEARMPEPDLFYNFELLSKIPSYEKLKGRIEGKNVLIRVNMNEPDPETDATRLNMQEKIIRFILDEGGTPILYGHGGRLDRDKDRVTVLKDNRFSFEAQAEYIQRLFPEKQVVFHKKSIRRCNIDKEEGLRIEKNDIVKEAVNIIENVRFGQGAETGSFREEFADQFARLSDGIFIFDAFGDVDSKGASVEDVPQSPYIEELYLGPEMLKEFAAIKEILEQGFDAMVTGGNKLEKLVKLEGAIKQSLNAGGFVLLGSGLSDALDKNPEQLAKFQSLGGKEIFRSDYSDETHCDIGQKALEQFLAKLDTLKPGNRVVVNGTLGLMEGDEKYKEGTKKIYGKLDELADRGVKIIVVGGDATKAGKNYGLLKNGGVQSFSGGGVALTLLSGEVLKGINALAKAQERIELAKAKAIEDRKIVTETAPEILYTNPQGTLSLTNVGVRRTALSTGHPTVEVAFTLRTKDGQEMVFTGEAASGASAGKREAIFLFDKTFAKKAEKTPGMLTDEMIENIYGEDVSRKEALRKLKTDFEGKGVEIALWIARNTLIPELTRAIQEDRVDPSERYAVDRFMIDYEKTHGGSARQKTKLTGNNTTAFSSAAAKLGAALNGMETWEFLAYRPDPDSLEIDYKRFGVVIPQAVVIEGGEHGNWNTDFQEFMVEVRGDNLDEITTKLANITFALENIIKDRGEKIGVGMEDAYLPTVTSNIEPIEMIVQAGRDAGYTPGVDFAIAIDAASSEFYKQIDGQGYYCYRVEGRNNKKIVLGDGRELGKFRDIQIDGKKTRVLLLTTDEQFEFAVDIYMNPDNYISSLEDLFDQDDTRGNRLLTQKLQDRTIIAGLPHEFQRREGISHVGDDISTSNIEVVMAGLDGGTVNLGSGKEAESLTLEKDTIDDVLLKLNQAGTVMEVMDLAEELGNRGRTRVHSHRGKEPPKETIRGDVALASTTYPTQRHDRKDVRPVVKMKYGTYRKERAPVYDTMRLAYAKIGEKIKTQNLQLWAEVFPEKEFKTNKPMEQIEPKRLLKIFSKANVVFNKNVESALKDESRAIVINYQLLLNNPSLGLAIVNAKHQFGNAVKFVLGVDESVKENTLYENIKSATNGLVDLKDKFDLVIVYGKRTSPQGIVKFVKTELNVENIEIIGPRDWAMAYQTADLENCIVLICELGKGNETARGDMALWIGLNALVKEGLLTKEERATLSANRTKSDFYVIKAVEIKQDIQNVVDNYEAWATSG